MTSNINQYLLCFFICVFISINTVCSQDLPKYGSVIKDFIPYNWRLIDQVRGDLNKDGVDDLAFVLEKPVNCKVGELCSAPRILAIAFAEDDKYKLEIQADKFIINCENDEEDDPFENLLIKKGSLVVKFKFWTEAVSWFYGTEAYIFRWQNNQFELIGQEIRAYHRTTGKGVKQSVNYSTRKNYTAYYSTKNNRDIDPTTQIFAMKQLYVLSRNTDRYDFKDPPGRSFDYVYK